MSGAVTEAVEYGPSDLGKLTLEDQEKLGVYVATLRKSRDELPAAFQARIPNEKLRELAMCLLDGTVFEIVRELEDIQQLNERSLLNRRMKMVGGLKTQRLALNKRHGEEVIACEHRAHNLPVVKAKHEKEKHDMEKRLLEEVRSVDQGIILELDQIVTEQQSTLQQAAVPFFIVTNRPEDVQLQMYILGFIMKLSGL